MITRAEEAENRIADDLANGWATPMAEPTVLYRSISIPELSSVLRTGFITGGQNRFNMFDGRPLVFFGDALSEWLIGQGEHAYRQAYYASQFTAVFQELSLTSSSIEYLAGLILVEMDRDTIPYDREAAEMLEFGGHGSGRLRRAAMRHVSTRKKYKAAFAVLKRLALRERILADAHVDEVARIEAEIVDSRADQMFSSAVLVTHPICGGIKYPTAAYQGGAEYGFAPRGVALSNIREVVLIKDRRVALRVSL